MTTKDHESPRLMIRVSAETRKEIRIECLKRGYSVQYLLDTLLQMWVENPDIVPKPTAKDTHE